MQDDDSIDPIVVLGAQAEQTALKDGDTSPDASQLRLLLEMIPQLVWRSLDEGN